MNSSTSSSQEFRVRDVDTSNIGDLIGMAEETSLSPWSSDDLIAEIRNPNGILLKVVSDSNEILGFVIGRIVPADATCTDVDAEIYNIAVTPNRQRQKLGQRLLDEFVGKCKTQSVANIWLEVRESNDKAVKFYRKNGFEQVQTRKDFYRNPVENALLMRLLVKYQTA